jgi:outer membrane protein assembly factor BamB
MEFLMPKFRTTIFSVVQAFSLHKREARNPISLLILALLLVSCSSGRTKLAYTDSTDHNWLTPRSDAANTGHVASSVINEPYTILWKVKTGGVAASEPIVRDGLIFFSGLDRRLEVYDLATGERRFRKRFDGPVLGVIPGDSTFGVLVDQVERRYFTYDLRTARQTGNFKVPTVSAAPRTHSDSTILLGTWHGQVFCYTHDGREIWHTECDGPVLSPPAIVDSVVYVASGRSLFALKSDDGATIWEHGVSGAIEGGPAVDDHVYFGAIDSFATALRKSDGELVWSTRLGGGVFAAPAIGDSLVYFASNDGSLTALDKNEGIVQWTYDAGAVANLSPTLCGDLLLITSRQATVAMLSAANGEQLWSDSTLSAQAMTSPVVVGDRILLTDSRRLLICLAPASQSPLATPSE